jgi:hypothetical protein
MVNHVQGEIFFDNISATKKKRTYIKCVKMMAIIKYTRW